MKKSDTSLVLKKTGGELSEYLHFKRRGSVVSAKKGKGSFARHPKHKKF